MCRVRDINLPKVRRGGLIPVSVFATEKNQMRQFIQVSRDSLTTTRNYCRGGPPWPPVVRITHCWGSGRPRRAAPTVVLSDRIWLTPVAASYRSRY